MKTPREILLERHLAAVPKLDKLRRETVNAEFPRRNSPVALLNWPALFWRELIRPCRRVWTGLAAVWILILAANFSMHDNSQPVAPGFPITGMMASLPNQQELLDDLLADRAEPMTAKKPKVITPGPRTEIMTFLPT